MELGVVLASLLSSLLALSLPTRAESPIPAANPADIHFEVRIANGATEFKLGELIRVELVFTTSSPGKYQADLSSGRFDSGDELFRLEPEIGWSRPAARRMQPSPNRCGGCLLKSVTTGTTPVSAEVMLNEWVHFDRPGRYRLRAETNRVSLVAKHGLAGEPVGLRSNTLALSIVPASPAWQEQTLRRALAVVDGPVRDVEQFQEAIDRLRALGTEVAAREMARRLQNNDIRGSALVQALSESPQRQVVLEEMDRLLADPDQPVTLTFLDTLSFLQTGDADKITVDEDPDGSSFLKRRSRAYSDNYARLRAALPQKRGAARFPSLLTAFEAINKVPNGGEVPAPLLQELVAVFDQVPARDQSRLLHDPRWDQEKGRSLLPVLRRLAQPPTDAPGQPAHWDYESDTVRGEAFRRWYELEPEEARAAVIREIVRPSPRLGAETLGFLPDVTLPEADSALAEHLKAGEGIATVASLLQRYATAAAAPVAVEVLDARLGSWACAAQTSLLAYLLRVDPALARPRIEAVLALRDRHDTRCYESLLTAIGRLRVDPLLTEIATRSLADREPTVANDAARFLAAHGPASAEASLWKRYEEWCVSWRGREEELRSIATSEKPVPWGARLGQSLAGALVTGRGWLADEAKLERVKALAVGESVAREAVGVLPLWRRRPWTILYDGGTLAAKEHSGRSLPPFRVLQYSLDSFDALEQKLAQFPRGSTFYWRVAGQGPAGAAEGERLSTELSKFLTGLGMELRPTPTH